MRAPNDYSAPSSTTAWWRWGTPPRSGLQRLIAPWEYGRGELPGRRLGAEYRSFRISPNLSLR